MKKKRYNQVISISFLLFIFLGFFAFLFLPKPTYSESERRELAKKPTLSVNAVFSGHYMKDFEKYMMDTFIGRDAFRQIKAYCAQHVFLNADNNGIYKKDGHLVKMDYPYNKESVKRATDRFQQILTLLEDDVKDVYISIIPDKGFYLNDDHAHLSYDFKQLEEQVTSAIPATYIPLYDILDKDDYYKSDLHWRQEQLLPIANRFASALGVRIDQEYEIKKVEQPFYGVYAKQASSKDADVLYYLNHDRVKDYEIYDHQNQKEISFFDLEKAQGRDPYEAFLSGPLSYVTIKNKQATTHKKLLVFRDSFSSSLMPLLSSGYEEISLVDIRYIRFEQLQDKIDATNADVLFLYNSYVYNHSEVLK